MSIQTALNSALSGLHASQASAALVAHNTANATTEGYVGKTLDLSTKVTGGVGQGVNVDGIARDVDELLIRDARQSQSAYVGSEARASLLADYTTTIGQPQDESSVAAVLSDLQLAFDALHSAPDEDSARTAVVNAAKAVAESLNSTAEAAQGIQQDARDRMAVSVDTVNSNLHRISELNEQIATATARGIDSGDLQDERDLCLDAVAEEIGIRTYTRDNGSVVVMTLNGKTLLDRSLPDGAEPLQMVGNDLFVNGENISDEPDVEVQSGRLMGYLQVADEDMPKVLEQLDQLAAGLVQAFQNAEDDPTQAGLFTDAGSAYSAAGGLASRIEVNAALDGNTWRIQSGIQATTPLASGDQTQIDAYLDVFDATLAYVADDVPSSATLGDYASSMISIQQGYRTTAESTMTSLETSAETLKTARTNRDGVNVDDETAKLLLIEQSYAASAQVISVVGNMLDTLLSITR